mgnify:CR=1 FL=1
MGSGHARHMAEVKEVKFTAVADVDPAKVKAAMDQYDVEGFASSTELIASGLCDAVLIATPHFFHPTIAIEAMRAGLHVYAEKPLAVNLSAADEMIRVARETGQLLQIGFNSRATPAVQAAKRIVEEGRLGEIYRTLLIDSRIRNQAYYDSATWRATWAGEGGGVLMNQAPHELDRLVMLTGRPSRVYGQVKTRRHRIEVEDEASAIIEYPNGATGYVFVSVNEAPVGNRLEILGEKGKLVMAERALQLWELPQAVQEWVDSTTQRGNALKGVEVPVEVPAYEGESHADMLANLARAIIHGEPLLCPPEEALGGLELADAMLMSGFTGKPVDIPVDRQAFDAFLAEKQAASQGKPARGA